MFGTIAAVEAIASSQIYQARTTQYNITNQIVLPDLDEELKKLIHHGESIAADKNGTITHYILVSGISYGKQELEIRSNVQPYDLWTDRLVIAVKKHHTSVLIKQVKDIMVKELSDSMNKMTDKYLEGLLSTHPQL